MRLFIFIMAILTVMATQGCASLRPAASEKVEVPIECRVQAPQRPAMPSDNLTIVDSLDTHIKTIQAEIGIREGYEIELRAALGACMSPVAIKAR